MKSKDRKDRWLIGIFIGIIANSMVIWSWVPLFFLLEPGRSYRNYIGLFVGLLFIPITVIYGIFLSCVPTKHRGLKLTAVIFNCTPTLILILVVILLAMMGHMPAE